MNNIGNQLKMMKKKMAKKLMIKYCINKHRSINSKIKKCIETSQFPLPEPKHYTVYGLSYCPYTGKTEQLLKKLKRKFKLIIVDNNTSFFRKGLNRIGGYKKRDNRTFPVIFHKQSYIGGYDNLNKYLLTFKVYGLSYCPYSKKTIKLLNEEGYNYKFVTVDNNKNKYRNRLNGKGGYDKDINRTSPIIYCKHTYIGGFSDLNIFLK